MNAYRFTLTPARLLYCILFIAAILLLAKVLYIAHRNTGGYCSSTGKYLNDGERLRVVVSQIIKEYPPSVILKKHHPEAVASGYLPPERPINYLSVEDFFHQNKNCCEISKFPTPESRAPNWVEKATGVFYGYALVNYKVNYIDDTGALKTIRRDEVIPISNCGNSNRWWDAVDTNGFDVIYYFLTRE